MEEILNAIPHREPFLFVDKIIEQTETSIKTQKTADADSAFFKGHYPDYPIMPGVLICEAVFQAGAILMSGKSDKVEGQIPVVARMNNVKFKRGVFPGDVLEVYVASKETVGQAHYMVGKVTVDSRTVLVLEFAVMMVEEVK
jgi:3-hydroxyacyl-[acyl-carrier-protein] dehydratase